jgi:tetraacyldisaccharide 4'-kinase
VKLSTPRWWYQREGRPAPVIRVLLRPASWAWAAVTARRIARARPVDPGAPVVSVGNLTVGGSGKTPIARELLARLSALGVDAHGLSRGYGGSEAGPLRVDPARHTASKVGDEPLMLAGEAPIWVARDRVAGARAAVAAGATALVLDDAHQNPALRKTLSLVVVDGETREGEWPFGDGSVFPAGPMREPFAVGVARADAIVVLLPADLEAPDPELLATFGSKSVLMARLEPAVPPPSGSQVGFAGVAKPWKVERALRAAGCELADFVPLPDHAPLDEPTLKLLADRAQVFGAGLVTTEKDWVRLPPGWRERVTAWPVRARFEDERALDALLSALVDLPALHDEAHALQFGHVGERVARHGDEIRRLARRERADVGLTQVLGGDDRGRADRLDRRHAGANQQGELPGVVPVSRDAGVGAEGDLDPARVSPPGHVEHLGASLKRLGLLRGREVGGRLGRLRATKSPAINVGTR